MFHSNKLLKFRISSSLKFVKFALLHAPTGHDYFSFWIRGVCCIVLNSQLYKSPEECTSFAEEQEDWLEDLLVETKKAKPKAVIAFSHISPFIKSPKEPDGYFNWSEPSRTKTMDALLDVGCKSWFCGHYHRNSVGRYIYVLKRFFRPLSQKPGLLIFLLFKNSLVAHLFLIFAFKNTENRYKSMEVVTTAAVGVNIVTNPDGNDLETTGVGGGLLDDDHCGFRIVKLDKHGKVSHKFLNFTELEKLKAVEFCQPLSDGG